MKAIRIWFLPLVALFTLFSLVSCRQSGQQLKSPDTLKGDLIIFHAGSLSVPLKEICDSFMSKHPAVKILTEAAGSKDCARKISDLKKPCDVMLSADYAVIDKMLIPEYASWNIHFASNEMAIVYHDQSRYASDINAGNWMDVLARKDVAFARSNPDSDPCGVRAVLTTRLAEIFYKKKGLADQLLSKDQQYIRPKETDLLALLESNAIDYIFLYRSVAMQHGLKYVLLPDEINLKNEKFADYYAQVSVETLGKKPGEKIVEKGAPMIYGLTIPKNAPNPALAQAFVDFMLGAEGRAILEKQGQPSVIPAMTSTYTAIPDSLKKYALEAE
jgi:molybdate/tungstate transport system substrate-binding protein